MQSVNADFNECWIEQYSHTRAYSPTAPAHILSYPACWFCWSNWYKWLWMNDAWSFWFSPLIIASSLCLSIFYWSTHHFFLLIWIRSFSVLDIAKIFSRVCQNFIHSFLHWREIPNFDISILTLFCLTVLWYKSFNTLVSRLSYYNLLCKINHHQDIRSWKTSFIPLLFCPL